MRAIPILALALLLAAPATARDDLSTRLRAGVEQLAGEELGGRGTGSEGERLAADWLVAQLQAIGAQPLEGLDGYRHAFDFGAGNEDAGSWVELAGQRFAGADDILALGFSDDGEITAPVVFAGYGLVTPDGSDAPYDSYHGLNVDGKIVLVLRYSPEDAGGDLRRELARYSGLRYKAMHAREAGAVGMLVVAGPNSPNAGETLPPGFDAAVAGSGIQAATVSLSVVAEMLQAAGVDESLADLQAKHDTGNPHVQGFALEGVTATLHCAIERQTGTAHNVLARLPADPPAGGRALGGAVLLGAHYDHLGTGDRGSSRAGQDEASAVHPGADDNASGTVAVVEIARALAQQPRERDLLLAFWSGEEIGLLGSAAFVEQEVVAPGELVAYLNLDMVGRVRDNALSVQGAGSSPAWAGLVERANAPVGFALRMMDDPWLPTDATSLYGAGVPVLSLFSGTHDEYHTPRDTPATLDYDELARVVQFGTLLTQRLLALDEAPSYAELPRRRAAGGDRESLRAWTGTIPDYGQEVEGLRLSGVVDGGPAAEAGLQAGDIIVEFGGTAITNIYDYTYALEGVKVGVPLAVVVLRDGERLEVEITPTTR